MLKKDIIAKLTELNIEHDPKALAKELEALLPEGEREVNGEATEAAVHSTKTGAHFRTYTKEVHGDDFEDLAKEFSAHTPDSEVRVK